MKLANISFFLISMFSCPSLSDAGIGLPLCVANRCPKRRITSTVINFTTLTYSIPYVITLPRHTVTVVQTVTNDLADAEATIRTTTRPDEGVATESVTNNETTITKTANKYPKTSIIPESSPTTVGIDCGH
ncbi:hypothetical protein TWF970_010800 [Orbilia oligospora]|uniref:Uncharacterized protein n=1 Tax=Orbilia oligospora TaxID=2813651 RepID=A0A7C8R254_ORBOL|nr:hypothetical protein TWF970_010800 [Orbilia oligospora]